MRIPKLASIAAALSVAAALALGGCTTAEQQDVTTGLSNAEAACQAAAPLVTTAEGEAATAPAATQATVQSLLTYEQSVCASEATVDAAVAAAPNGDSGTAAWIENIAGGIVSALPGILALI